MSVPAQLVSLATNGLASLLAGALQQKNAWGVFDLSGSVIISTGTLADNILGFSYSQDYNVAKFPIIGASFSDYNKVIQPAQIRLRMAKGGTQSQRTAFLLACQNLIASLQGYQLRTPEGVFTGYNPTRMEYDREGAEGANFIEVTLAFEQILQGQQQFSTTLTAGSTPSLQNAQDASAQPVSNVGTVQVVDPGSLGQVAVSALATATPVTF